MTTDKTKVLVGVPTYNGASRVDWLLQNISMRTENDIDYKVVICDDSENVNHQQKVVKIANKWKDLGLTVDVIINEKNVGVPTSWNRIVKSQESQHVILMNDDVLLAKDWLSSMTYFLDNNPNAGAVGHSFHIIDTEDIEVLLSSSESVVKPRDPVTRSQYDIPNICCLETIPKRCLSPIGAIFGFRKDMYNMVGGFDEGYFATHDDLDFGTSLASHGYPSYMLSYPINWHMHSATILSAPEASYKIAVSEPGKRYIEKWGGYVDVTFPRYMNKIPFQKVKWICKDKEYENLSN
jgi:GT2 family glycosyltransferase